MRSTLAPDPDNFMVSDLTAASPVAGASGPKVWNIPVARHRAVEHRRLRERNPGDQRPLRVGPPVPDQPRASQGPPRGSV